MEKQHVITLTLTHAGNDESARMGEKEPGNLSRLWTKVHDIWNIVNVV